MEQRKNIYLLFKEAVNNVIKHAGAKNIYIFLKSSMSSLSLFIKDDGKGFDSNTAKSGNGLRNIKRRADSIKGTVYILSEHDKGTSIELFVPY